MKSGWRVMLTYISTCGKPHVCVVITTPGFAARCCVGIGPTKIIRFPHGARK